VHIALLILFAASASATAAGLVALAVTSLWSRGQGYRDGSSGSGESGEAGGADAGGRHSWRDSVDLGGASRNAGMFVLSMLAAAAVVGRLDRTVSLADLAVYAMTFGFGAAFVGAVEAVTPTSRTVRRAAATAAVLLPVAGGLVAGVTGLV
jgi:hypothetical protein